MSARGPFGHARSKCRGAALFALTLLVTAFTASPAPAQVAVRGGIIYTMAGDPIENGVVVIRDGTISAVGPAGEIGIPDQFSVLDAAVVTPGLIDARSTVGLTGIYNQPEDQDQIETSAAVQPELRAIDAYNPREELIDWARSFGVTTVHTGHAPGELVSGQTMVVKLAGNTVEEALLREPVAVAATLGPAARRSGGSPGTRGKMTAMLREELIRARQYLHERKRGAEAGDGGEAAETERRDGRAPAHSLRRETLAKVLDRRMPLLVTAHRAQDIATALRLAEEFDIDLWLDGASEAYLMKDEIKAAGVPVFLHPTMTRVAGERENVSFETAAKLREAGITVLMQSGHESYVPKMRVVLFEAAVAAAFGLGMEDALAMITREAARVLGIDDRVGTIEVGKDGDLALYSGDPFEYTTHCIGVIIDGRVVSDEPR